MSKSFAYSALRQRLGEIGDLPAGWDDENAAPVAPEALSLALALCAALYGPFGERLAHPRASPCADGSVDLHWKADSATALVNINHDGAVDFYVEIGGLSMGGKAKFQACGDARPVAQRAAAV